jgi:hypothetical protein
MAEPTSAQETRATDLSEEYAAVGMNVHPSGDVFLYCYTVSPDEDGRIGAPYVYWERVMPDGTPATALGEAAAG